MSVLAVLFMSAGEVLKMQAHGAGTAWNFTSHVYSTNPLMASCSSRHPLHRLNPTISHIYL